MIHGVLMHVYHEDLVVFFLVVFEWLRTTCLVCDLKIYRDVPASNWSIFMIYTNMFNNGIFGTFDQNTLVGFHPSQPRQFKRVPDSNIEEVIFKCCSWYFDVQGYWILHVVYALNGSSRIGHCMLRHGSQCSLQNLKNDRFYKSAISTQNSLWMSRRSRQKKKNTNNNDSYFCKSRYFFPVMMPILELYTSTIRLL